MRNPPRRWRPIWLVPPSLLAALALALGCVSPGETPSSRRIVIVVSVDSLRASRVGAYGYSRPTTPSLDRFAEQSFRFSDARSTSSWTKPSMASLYVARPVHEHLAVFSLGRADQLASFMAGLEWDLEAKQAAMGRGMVVPQHLEPFHARLSGFEKGAFLNNPHLAPEFGFDRSWDVFRQFPPKKARKGLARAGEIHTAALRFLDERPSGDVYLWIHHNDVHHPYGPVEGQAGHFREDFSEEEFRSYARAQQHALAERAQDDPRSRRLLSALYDAGLRAFDEELGAFFDALRERGLFHESMIIVTADHGEEFFEHGVFGHGHNLFDVTNAIPLLLKLPHQEKGEVVGEPVSLIDIGPTVLDFAGVSDGETLPGQSLLPVVREGRRLDRPLLSELVEGRYEVTLVRSRRKLRVVFDAAALVHHLKAEGAAPLEPSLVELYDLDADPGEQRPLSLPENEALLATLQDELRAALGGERNLVIRLEKERELGHAVDYRSLLGDRSGKSFREIEEQLEALGYL